MGIKSEAVICVLNENTPDRKVVIRMSGNDYVLVEYGEMKLDVGYRVRLYWLEKIIRQMQVAGIRELSPGVRSMLIYYDSLTLPLNRLVEVIRMAEKSIAAYEDQPVPSRLVKLPIAFHDEKCLAYVRKYMESVRAEAPYLPDNMEFVARCNGLDGVEKVQEYFLATEHLVIGLGDVYLGAPCAVPLDPRYRMSAPKYNPARTMTPEGAVGIGGAFMCIYPMESPGGYQLIGRTVPFWDTWQLNDAFREAPWLLRPFDRVQFVAVSEEELDRMGAGVHNNTYQFEIADGEFEIGAYEEFCRQVEPQALAFRRRQAESIGLATQGY
ncbi:carboxyltransferase domain-containing protein [Anaerotruncus rubiinfantis]|uniref:carboxyltransferase domain-containing protein n=1 Tax=Anaerotruncus rubiinfantis TaxID=1720200 RepID=UPI0008322A08|nr:carboxyltransferase domain-containing protein [Anaerotruncus rubiinfantis]